MTANKRRREYNECKASYQSYYLTVKNV